MARLTTGATIAKTPVSKFLATQPLVQKAKAKKKGGKQESLVSELDALLADAADE